MYALDRVFVEYNHSHCIIVEDDMIFSPDFLLYFEKTAHLVSLSFNELLTKIAWSRSQYLVHIQLER